MIVGGESTIIDYHAPFDQGLSGYDSSWTSCRTIQGVIVRVIAKSDEREARGQFEITSTITP